MECDIATNFQKPDNNESINFLQFLTTVFTNKYSDLNLLIAHLKNFSNSLNETVGSNPLLISQDEIKQQLLGMASFRKSAKFAVTNVTQTLLTYIKMNDVFEGNSQMRQCHYMNIARVAVVLKKYLLAVHPHFKISYIEECTYQFIVSLMHLLRNVSTQPTENNYILSTVTHILRQFTEVSFAVNVILKETLTNLQVCEMNLLSFSTTALFKLVFYEKLMCNLLILKDLLLCSIEQHELYHSSDYNLNVNIVLSTCKVLSTILSVAPEYLKRSVQECLNLIK